MRILEIYPCDQGEGKLTSVASVLIRTFGCDLDCHWCDTKYSINLKYHNAFQGPPIKDMHFLDVVGKALDAAGKNVNHFILSGGEPTIQEDFTLLVNDLTSVGFHVTVETNGMHYFPPDRFGHPKRVLWSISPKMKRAYTKPPDMQVLESFMREWHPTLLQFKFVISLEDEIPQALNVLDALPWFEGTQIFLYPNGEWTSTTGRGDDLESYFVFMKRMRETVNQSEGWAKYTPRILPQMHVLLHGAKTRNV